MTRDNILSIIDFYEENMPHFLYLTFNKKRHLLFMYNEIRSFISDDIEKAFRWLGFIQGVLWSHKLYTIEDLKNHNKGIFNKENQE